MEIQKRVLCLACMVICFAVLVAVGCGSREEKAKEEKNPTPPAQDATGPGLAVNPLETPPVQQSAPGDLVAQVDGTKLTKKELEAELGRMMSSIGDKVPAEKRAQVKSNMRKQLRDNFIIRTLLTNEIARQKIKATDKEVDDAVAELTASLPPNVTLDEFMKTNQLTRDKMREEIRFGIKANKLVVSQAGKNVQPSDQEIRNFYAKNKDKFKMPETAHVRHILVAKTPEDDETVKAQKRAKADDLRNQLLAGADFAELAAKNSDCPSKQNGGELGTFARGQMVKPFEDAAFSQPVKTIGPVVETQFGYHVIQVLERNAPKTMPLDTALQEKIAGLVKQKKKQEAFKALLDKLKSKANIAVYER
jgi:peptidyl-prolyl cis-trans isomerase C